MTIVNFRDPARFVELFITSEQVMTDEMAYEEMKISTTSSV